MFSVIIEYKGGTFVHQIFSNDVVGALKQTFKYYLQMEEYKKYFNEKLMNEIDFSCANDLGPILLNGMVNIWYFHFSVGSLYGHCHLVKMDSIPVS